MLLVGAISVAGRVLGSLGAEGGRHRRRARTMALWGASVALVIGVTAPLARTPRSSSTIGAWLDTSVDTVTSSSWGHTWFAQEVALACACLAAWKWWSNPESRTAWRRWALLAAMAAVFLESWSGHASTLPTRSLLAALVATVHVMAVGVWVGGLVVLLVCLVPGMVREQNTPVPRSQPVWAAFSPIAAVAAALVVASGLYESGRYLPDLGSVGSTTYGSALALKVVLLLLALSFAAGNTLVVNPTLADALRGRLNVRASWLPFSPRRFVLLLFAEAVVLLLAVGVASALTSTTPARSVALADQSGGAKSATADGVFVTFEEVPIGSETSRLIVRTSATSKIEPTPVESADVTLTSANQVVGTTLRTVEPGRFEADAAQLSSGTWAVSVVLHRPGLPDADATFAWSAGGSAETSMSGLEELTSLMAVLLVSALFVGVVVWRSREGADVERRADLVVRGAK